MHDDRPEDVARLLQAIYFDLFSDYTYPHSSPVHHTIVNGKGMSVTEILSAGCSVYTPSSDIETVSPNGLEIDLRMHELASKYAMRDLEFSAGFNIRRRLGDARVLCQSVGRLKEHDFFGKPNLRRIIAQITAQWWQDNHAPRRSSSTSSARDKMVTQWIRENPDFAVDFPCELAKARDDWHGQYQLTQLPY